MEINERALLISLISEHRWAGLSTIAHDGAPHASMVAYVSTPDLFEHLMLLSRLSKHTRNLLADPRASLVISTPDPLQGDPQTLPRVTLTGSVTVIERDTIAWTDARAHYLARLPDSERLFGFGDFVLFRFIPKKARHIGGFARAFTIGAVQLKTLLAGDDVPELTPAMGDETPA